MKRGFCLLVFLVCGLLARAVPGAVVERSHHPVSLRHATRLISPVQPSSFSHMEEKTPLRARMVSQEEPRPKPRISAANAWLYYPPLLLMLDDRYQRVTPGGLSSSETLSTARISQTSSRALSSSQQPAPSQGRRMHHTLHTPHTLLFVAAGMGIIGLVIGLLHRQRRRASWATLTWPSSTHDVTRLPVETTPWVGRWAMLRRLRGYLMDPQVAVVGCIAPAGVGKTALVHAWLRMMHPRYGGVHRRFAWSFHHQTSSLVHGNAGLFFVEALRFFGYTDPLPAQEEACATLLAEQLRRHPSILILDGLDALIVPGEDAASGYCWDPGMSRFLRLICRIDKPQAKPVSRFPFGLFARASGLVVMTSRHPIQEMTRPAFTQRTGRIDTSGASHALFCAGYRHMPLENLTVKEGVRMLKELGVDKKHSQALQRTVRAMHGHALSLALIGRLLARRGPSWHPTAFELNHLYAPGAPGEHVPRILNHYDSDVWPGTTPHGRFLRLLGLLDRPMTEVDFQLLRADASLARPLRRLGPDALRGVLDDLQQAGLIHSSLVGRCWQSHALVRDHFYGKLQKEQARTEKEKARHASGNPAPSLAPSLADTAPGALHADALKQAHRELFDYFQVMAEESHADMRRALEPLYRAVWHGCQAGLYQEARALVFEARIHRGRDRFSQRTLGAYGADVTALAGFFPRGWEWPPVPDRLSVDEQAWVLEEGVRCLTAVGKLADALKLQEERVRLETERGAQERAIHAAAALCALQRAVGSLSHALTTAEYGKKWAEQRALDAMQTMMQANQAVVLHRLGRFAESHALFQMLETRHAAHEPEHPGLDGMAGVAYADLLLEQRLSPLEALLDRVQVCWQRASQRQEPVLMASSLMVRGRILSAMEDGESAHEAFASARTLLERMGRAPVMAEWFLQYALFMRRSREQDSARHTLEEGLALAKRCGMALLVVDGTLLEGHLLLDENRQQEARTALVQAEAAIEHLAYGQRRQAAADLRHRWS